MDTDAERGNRRSRFLLLGGALAVAVFLAGCATKPASGPRVLLEISSVRAEALDQHRTLFSFVLTAANTGGKALESVSASYALSLDGASAAASCLDEPLRIPAGESRDMRFEVSVDIRDLSGDTLALPISGDMPWTLAAELRSPGAAGDILLASAEAKGSYPLIREPELTITSIILVKHELINVLLELVLDVRNPNAFTVDFASASYQFYGEGRRWANGSVERAISIPARGTAEVRLPIVLNFTETGRNLFDLVAKLKVVRYRLAGEARVVTSVPFLPEFRMKFDKSGATQVERALPTGL